MDLNPEANKKIEELQVLENHLQGFLAQKQAVQIEMNEVDNALGELKDSDDEIYKMVSGFMIKSTKAKIKKELEEKKKLLNMRVDSMEKQEKLVEKDMTNLREELDDIISKSKKGKK
ncbi:MAG: prefoldin subunit beta [Nanoarchaeota archaeon]